MAERLQKKSKIMTTMSSVTVRAAERHDLPQLCQVRNTAPLYLGYLDECDGQAAHFLVAEQNGQIVGFGVVYLAVTKTGKKKSHLPKLSDLYVAGTHRRRGVATALIQARERLAKQAGHSEIFVSIDPVESAEMIALAKKLAYQPMQAKPYSVDATYYDTDGRPYAKRYFRLDFAKRLDLKP